MRLCAISYYSCGVFLNEDLLIKESMKTSVKFILTFLLLALNFSVAGNTMNVEKAQCNNESCCQLSSSNCEQAQILDGQPSGWNKSQDLTNYDVELGFKPVSETNSYTNNLRLRRIIETSGMLSVMRKLSLLRENLLVLDQNKTFNSDRDPHYVTVSCDYYIFALRRILI